MAALYVLGVLMPAAAFAASQLPSHCLPLATEAAVSSDHHHGDMTAHAGHAMSDTTRHHDPAPTEKADLPGKCCGLLCATAIAPPAIDVAAVQLVVLEAVSAAPVRSLSDRPAGRIDRPPRTSSSL